MNIYITGYGLISSIGKNIDESLSSLKNYSSGIEESNLKTTKGFKVGAIKATNDELKKEFNIKTDCSRTALLGIIASKQAFYGHNISKNIRTGLISGTSVGGMDTSELEYKKYLESEKHDINIYQQHSSGISSEQIAFELGISDFINTISTACSSAANAIIMGARMIENGF